MAKAIKKAKKDSKQQKIPGIKLEKLEDDVKREHQKLMEKQPRYQTADVLIFQRYDNEKDIPEGRKTAFRDDNGKPYIMRFRRHFTIDEIDIEEADEYIGKRVFDYQDSFKRVIELLETSGDFQMFNKDYVNCIILNSVANIDEMGESSDMSDDDLFMTRKEDGIYNRNVKFNKEEKTIDNNSCFVNLIVKRFKKLLKRHQFIRNTSSN